jgi:SPP1 family predicted phage head-tail adaptor
MISKLDKRAAFQSPTVTVSAGGGHTNVFATYATVWAEFKLEKSELIGETAKVLENIGIVKVRNSSDMDDLTKDSRIVIDSKNYFIIGIDRTDKDYIKIKVRNEGV